VTFLQGVGIVFRMPNLFDQIWRRARQTLTMRTIKEIMHCRTETVRCKDSVQHALDELKSQGVSSVPLIDKDGQLAGSISEGELTRKVAGFGHDPKVEHAENAQNSDAPFCFEDQTLAEAQTMMIERSLTELPVVTREKQLVGIIKLENITLDSRQSQ
jgi:CBS domain-containing protein